MMSALSARMQSYSFATSSLWSASWASRDYMSEWEHMAMVMWNGSFSSSWSLFNREP